MTEKLPLRFVIMRVELVGKRLDGAGVMGLACRKNGSARG